MHRGNILKVMFLALIVGGGIFVRTFHLDHPPLRIDEAESAINALTILQHGYPSNTYVGEPIFENTLTRPWPGHPEFEFRDTSYSDKGMAVYHGWLPLYAMAGAFRLAGVVPDNVRAMGAPVVIPRDENEMRRRTAVARAPSVLFAILFMLTIYRAGSRMLGSDAGAIGLVIAAFAEPCVRVARQARYYSATLAIGALACLLIWEIRRRGRWRDFIGGAVVLAMLFHTHLLTFVVAVAWALITCWPIYTAPANLRKISVSLAILVSAIVPWIVLTGFPGPAASIPPARNLMRFPDDLISYLRDQPLFAGLLVAGAVAGVLAIFCGRLPKRKEHDSPTSAQRAADAWRIAAIPASALWLWVILAIAAFYLLSPASSAFLWRLTLSLQGPAILLAAMLLAGLARAIAPRYLAWVAPLLVIVFILRPAPLLQHLRPPPRKGAEPLYEAIDFLRTQPLRASTKIYALPFQHLPLMFYTGLPVQSIAPVRKTFLDQYPGDILLVDPAPRVQAIRHPDDNGLWQNPAIFRGYECYDRADFWPMFFYRFVDPARRSGEHLNYASRMATATRTVLVSGWTVYYSPGPFRPAGSSLRKPAAAGHGLTVGN